MQCGGSANLRDMHAAGRLEAVVADGDGLVLQQAHELILLDALLPDPAQDGEPLIHAQRRDASRESIGCGGRGSCGGGGSGWGCVGSLRGVHGGGGGGGGGREARRVSASMGDDRTARTRQAVDWEPGFCGHRYELGR